MIKREHIDIYRADRVNSKIFLSIVNKDYNILRAFESLEKLIEHLKKYPIENKELIIKELINK